jgi:hypothetical protein
MAKKTRAKPKAKVKARPKLKKGADGVIRLSGGNPQTAKGAGDAPVQAYIAAMPDWKRDVGKRLDALITKALPKVQKAVKWNSPFYGVAGEGYFLAFHVYTRSVKVAFLQGAKLKPLPPGSSKDKDVRYLDIHEGDTIDEKQFADWVKQAAKLPGFLGPKR